MFACPLIHEVCIPHCCCHSWRDGFPMDDCHYISEPEQADNYHFLKPVFPAFISAQRNRKVKQQHTGTIEKRKSMNSETDFVISREVISPFSGLTIINKQFFLFLVARFDWWVSHSWRITPLPCCLHEIFFMLSTDDNESHCLIVVQYIMTARRRGSIIVTQRTKPSKSLHHWSVLAQFHSSKQMHNPGMVE